jgi:arylsulfatase A-like enzyme
MVKKRYFRISAVLIALSIIFILTGCKDKPLQLKGDLILDFPYAERIVDGVSLCDGKEYSGKVHFTNIEGNNDFGVKGSVEGRKVVLSCYNDGASFLHLRARGEGEPPTETEVRINGNHLLRLALNPGDFSWYHLPLPEGLVNRGELKVEFARSRNQCFINAAYVTRGEKPVPDDELSELFSIKNFPLGDRVEKGFRLRPGTGIGYLLKPEDGDVLRFFLRGEGARLKVVVQTDKETRILKIVSPWRRKKKSVELPLSPFAGEIIELIFEAEGKDGSGMLDVISPRIMGQFSGKGKAQSYRKELEKAFNPPPNLVLILLDAARADHLTCYGYHRKTTPAIDQLAGEGVIFERAFSQGAYTNISLPGIFASLYPPTHKIIRQDDRLPEEMVTLAEVLSRHGVITGCFSDCPVVSLAHGYGQGFDRFDELFRLRGNPFDPTATPRFAGRVINWVKALPKEKPFFAFLHMMKPHEPYIAPFFFAGMFDKNYRGLPPGDVDTLQKIDEGRLRLNEKELDHIIALYDGNLAYADHQIGRLISHFKRAKLYENTIFVIIADHGEAFLEHGRMLHTTTVYDEMIHVPLIIRFPGRFPLKRKKVRSLTQLIDLTPTICELYGIEPGKLPFEGRSFLSAIFGEGHKGNPYIYSISAGPNLTMRGERYKYIYDGNEGRHFLFDLVDDPAEKRNLAFELPLMRKYFYSSLLSWYQLTSAKKIGEVKRIKLDRETEERLRALGYIK